jgi:hypothetical protein
MRSIILIIFSVFLVTISCSEVMEQSDKDIICTEQEQRLDWKQDSLSLANFSFSYPSDYWNFPSDRPYTHILSADSSIYMYFGWCNSVDPCEIVPFSKAFYLIPPYPDSVNLFTRRFKNPFYVCYEEDPFLGFFYLKNNFDEPVFEYTGAVFLKDQLSMDTVYHAGYIDFNKKDLETVKDILRTFKKY